MHTASASLANKKCTACAKWSTAITLLHNGRPSLACFILQWRQFTKWQADLIEPVRVRFLAPSKCLQSVFKSAQSVFRADSSQRVWSKQSGGGRRSIGQLIMAKVTPRRVPIRTTVRIVARTMRWPLQRLDDDCSWWWSNGGGKPGRRTLLDMAGVGNSYGRLDDRRACWWYALGRYFEVYIPLGLGFRYWCPIGERWWGWW